MQLSQERKNELIGILSIVLGIILGIGLFSDLAGIVGDGLQLIARVLAGNGAYLFPFLFFFCGAALIYSKQVKITPRLVGVIILLCTLFTLFHVLESVPGKEFPTAIDGNGGGLIGGILVFFLRSLLGPIGTYVVMGAAALVGVLLVFDILLVALLNQIKERLAHFQSRMKTGSENFKAKFSFKKPSKKQQSKKVRKPEREVEEEEEPFLQELQLLKPGKPNREIAVAAEPILDDEDLDVEKGEMVPLKLEGVNHAKPAPQRRKPGGPYQLPPVKLMSPSPVNKNKSEGPDRSKLLEQTLQNFGIQATVVSVSHGPTITRYELQPAPGIKVSRIVNLADDIALAMAAADVRIIAPIPGKAAVGVEVPNVEGSMVKLRDIIDHEAFQKTKAQIPLALGVDIGGEAVVADMVGMPHLLVAGATGSGKSVCINTIILSILYKARPEDVKILLVDPKKVELAVYRDLPHLLAPVVTDPKKASALLKMAVQEMERRYELFASSGTRGIEGYNQLLEKRLEAFQKAQAEGLEMEGTAEDFHKLPYIVVIIDELADLMMVAANDVEDSICRLAQMARAAGIHLIIATQRPSVDVITGLIKANIPSRIAFAVSSQVDSRTILDSAGAEKLLGKGDMLFSPVGANKQRRVQGAFVSTEEVQQIVAFCKKQAEPEYSATIEQLDSGEVMIEESSDRDELYEEAVRLVVTGSPSISILQRRLHIGYARAARLIDMMEQDGIVGPYAGSKPRELLIDESEIETILRKGK